MTPKCPWWEVKTAADATAPRSTSSQFRPARWVYELPRHSGVAAFQFDSLFPEVLAIPRVALIRLTVRHRVVSTPKRNLLGRGNV